MASITGTTGLALGQGTLEQLRRVLERELPEQAAGLIREVGFGAGHDGYDRFIGRVAERYGVETPQGLDARYLGDALSGFFRDEGWGSVSVDTLAPGIMAIDSSDWVEAEGHTATVPSCHFSTGLLSDFFTRLGGYPAAVMEVECRCRGDARCRFLVGSPDLLTWIYEGMMEGTGYDRLVASLRNA